MRVLAMNCENCDYELVDFEEDYFLCPKCGNIIVENSIKVKSKQLIINYASEFQKKVRILTKISESLSLFPFILFFLFMFTLFGFGTLPLDVLKSGNHVGGFKGEFPPAIIINGIYWATEKNRINFSRKIFGYKYFSPYRIYVYRAVRFVVYIICFYLIFKYIDDFLIPYIIENSRDDLAPNSLALAIKNEKFACTFILVYSFISHIIIDIIDIYAENCAYNINQEIKKYCEYY
jgi:hypothetical protein